MTYLFNKFKNIEVAWLKELDGGGRDTCYEFIAVVSKLIGKVDRICEFCAGPAFIGFSLLSEGLCDSICLIDVNPMAVEALRETIRRNNLEDRVTIYLSDGLSKVPESEKWDLVVSNPPHFCASSEEEYKQDIIQKDFNWSIHKNFYLNVHKFLNPHGSVIVQECYLGSEEKVFLPYIEKGNLHYIDSFMFKKKNNQWRDVYYFMWAKKRHEDFIWNENPEEVVRIKLSESSKNEPVEKLVGWRKYRFEILNDLDTERGVILSNGIGENGKEIKIIWIEKISIGQTELSNIFYLTPGKYELVDFETRNFITKFVVE